MVGTVLQINEEEHERMRSGQFWDFIGTSLLI
jgi:hypothetical protein